MSELGGQKNFSLFFGTRRNLALLDASTPFIYDCTNKLDTKIVIIFMQSDEQNANRIENRINCRNLQCLNSTRYKIIRC